MSSFDAYSFSLETLKDLAKNLSVASYGTKSDILGRLVQHKAGPSMLKTLLANSDNKAKPPQKPAHKHFEVKEKLSAKFCKDFKLTLVSKSTKDGVTTYTYAESKVGKVAPTKTIVKKKAAEKRDDKPEAVDADDDEDDEDDEDDGDGEFDFVFFKSKLRKTLGKKRALANQLLQVYEPTVPLNKIMALSDTKLFNALANIMCYDEE